MLKSFVARKQVAEGIQAEACLTPPRLTPGRGLHPLGPLILHGPLHSGSPLPRDNWSPCTMDQSGLLERPEHHLCV